MGLEGSHLIVPEVLNVIPSRAGRCLRVSRFQRLIRSDFTIDRAARL